jgi:hypothetical protein
VGVCSEECIGGISVRVIDALMEAGVDVITIICPVEQAVDDARMRNINTLFTVSSLPAYGTTFRSIGII